MRLLIGAVVGLMFSGCNASSSPLAQVPVRKVAREAADASWSRCREAVSRSYSRLTVSMPHDFTWQSWGSSVFDSVRDQTSLDEMAQLQAARVSKNVRQLSRKLNVAKPALARAVATTARVELKRSVDFLCETAAYLPIAALPMSPCPKAA